MASDDDRDQPSTARTEGVAETPPPPPQPAGIRYPHLRLVPAYYAEAMLPSARELAGYKAAGRGAPGAIISNFLAEGLHRRQLEVHMILAGQQRVRRGQHFALVIMLAGMLVSAWVVLAGHDWAGTAIAGGNLVAMGALFLRGRERSAGPPADGGGQR